MYKIICDDIDYHNDDCDCGLCNYNHKAYGAGIYKLICDDKECEHEELDECYEFVERHYACSEQDAIKDAWKCSQSYNSYRIWRNDYV